MAVLKSLVAKPTSLVSARFLPSALCAAVVLAAASSASAATLTVDDDGVRRNQYKTIQAALQAAAPGDRIRVLPGVYLGPINVDKAVEIIGAGNGTVPSGEQNDPTTDSIVVNDGQSGFDVRASNVTINGFTIQGTPSAPNYPNAGIFARTGTDRTFNFNVLEDNGLGIYIDGPQERLNIRNSAFLDNVRTPNTNFTPSGGIFTFGGPLNDSAITRNFFTGNQQFSMNIGGGSSAGLLINDNVADTESTFLVIGFTTNARIISNSVSNLINSGIVCFGQNSGMLIAQNTLQGGGGNGIRFTVNYGATTGDTNPIVRNNAISQFTLDGISLNTVSGATISNNTLQQNRDGIRLQSVVSSLIVNNDALNNSRNGISAESASTNNTIRRNSLTGNVQFDAFEYYDESTVPGPTVNTWINNSGVTQNRPGLLD